MSEIYRCDQQYSSSGVGKLFINDRLPVIACLDLLIIPNRKFPADVELLKVCFDILIPLWVLISVFVAIAYEEF